MVHCEAENDKISLCDKRVLTIFFVEKLYHVFNKNQLTITAVYCICRSGCVYVRPDCPGVWRGVLLRPWLQPWRCPGVQQMYWWVHSVSSSYYYKISNIGCTKSQNFNDFRLVLWWSLPNQLKPGVRSRMKMWLEQRRQAKLQLHLSDQQFYSQLKYGLY